MPCEDIEISTKTTEKTKIRLDLPQGVPSLISLYLYISGSCNLACRHCWIEPDFQKSFKNGKYIKLSNIRKAILEGKPLGLRSVKLTGGEPILHPKFKEIVTFINKEGIKIIIETNGCLIDKRLARFLKGKKYVSFVSVSLDGSEAETHDALRGIEGSYELALAGIKNLVDVGFRPQLICTLHKENVSQIKSLIKLAEKLGCGSVKFNHVQHIGRGEIFARKQGFEVDEIIELYRFIEKDIIPESKITIHFDIPFAFYSIYRLLKGALGQCSILNILGVLAGGELSLCGIGVTIPELVFGNIAYNKLSDVWCKSSSLISLREQIPKNLEGICGRCLLRNLCIGRCIADNYHRTKNINSAYYFCGSADKLDLFPNSRKMYNSYREG